MTSVFTFSGFIPGMMVMALYSGYLAVWALLNPGRMPPADPPMPLREKLRESMNLIPCLLLILLVFTVLESQPGSNRYGPNPITGDA